MSTTNLATGWSREWPHKADAGDEYYFVKRIDRNDIVVMGFSMDQAWLNGVAYEQSQMRNHLFLGPLTPANLEQLAALRTAAQLAMLYFESDPQATAHGREIAAALRNALGLQERDSDG